jgi:hypothetical protein
MIESPLIQEIIAESRQSTIVLVLIERFGPEAESIREHLKCCRDANALKELLLEALRCVELANFRAKLHHSGYRPDTGNAVTLLRSG